MSKGQQKATKHNVPQLGCWIKGTPPQFVFGLWLQWHRNEMPREGRFAGQEGECLVCFDVNQRRHVLEVNEVVAWQAARST
jgi:hypothetical protein